MSIAFPGMTEADWRPYMGNNHERIPVPRVTYGGSVSFARHLGKPLSQALWEDLVHRLGARGLCVYEFGACQWTIGWGAGHCCIHLDYRGNVEDIDWTPWPGKE